MTSNYGLKLPMRIKWGQLGRLKYVLHWEKEDGL
jgi:hypothetical protein